MQNSIENILLELGWKSDSFKIPVANEENKQLEEQIERKTKLLSDLKSELECLEDLIVTEKDNIKRFENEYDQNKKLICACSARVEMEKNLYNLAQSSNSKITKEIQEFNKNKKEINIKTERLEDEYSNLRKKVQATKQKIKQKHSYLLRCEEEIDKKEKRMQLIEEIGVQDEKKFRDSERERMKSREELEAIRMTVAKTIDEIHEMEIVLENTTKLHSEALAEHMQLIRQWSQGADVLQKRDKDIEETIKEISTIQEISRDKRKEIEETDNFLQHLALDNKTLELSGKQVEKYMSKVKEEYQKCVEYNEAGQTEIIVREKGIRTITRNTQEARSSVKQKLENLEKKEIKLDEFNKKVEELKSKLSEVINRRSDFSYKTRQLENTVENEIKKEESMIKKLKWIQNQVLITNNRVVALEDQFKIFKSQEMFEIKKSENLDALLVHTQKTLVAKNCELTKFRQEVHNQEKELDRIKGNDEGIEDIERRRQRIEQLSQIYNDKLAESKRLHAQMVVLENDVRQLTNSISKGNDQLNILRSKKRDYTLIMEGSEKQLIVEQTMTEDKQVAENILRLRVAKADKLLSKINDNVYDLEKYKLEIESLMQERKTDIAILKESLNLEKRLHSSKIAEMNNLIFERRTRIQQLQTRYYNFVSTFGNDQNGDETLFDTTYLRIQKAQEKFFLKEQGDLLDQAIRKCEYEIESMENTLKIVNACNSKFKSNFTLVDDAAPEKMERNKLNDEMYSCVEKIKQYKRKSQEIQKNLQKIQHYYEKKLKELEEIKEEREKKSDNLVSLDRQIMDQQNKISRAMKNIKKLLKFIHEMCACKSDDTVSIQENDINLKELNELNLLALQRLTEFVICHVEAEAYVKKLLSEKNIELLSVRHLKPSSASSRCECSTVSETDVQSKTEEQKIPSSRGSISSIINVQPPW